MGQTEFNITDEQAEMFARRIYANIALYIKEHQKEYEEFIKLQYSKRSENNEVKTTHRRKSL